MHWMKECSSPKEDKMEGKISDHSLYHEKQVKELCALHALNNLFQDKQAFSKKLLDDICLRLSPDHFVNPHRSIFGLGNYDVNVIMAALQTKDCETIWFDKRKDIDYLVMENIKGFILNIPSEFKLGVLRLPIKRKHWIAIRYIKGLYYNFDSKLPYPDVIGDEEQFKTHIRDQLENRNAELLLVVSQDIASAATWRKGETNNGQTPLANNCNVAHADNVEFIENQSNDMQYDAS